MSNEQAKRYCEEFEAGQAKMGPIKSLWQSILFYCMPGAEHLVWSRDTNQGEYHVPSDDTGIRASNIMASGIYSRTVSRGDRVADLSIQDPVLNRRSDVQEHLSSQITKLTQLIHASNYAPSMFEMLKHFTTLGTDLIYSYYDLEAQRLHFKTYRPFDCWMQEDASGRITKLLRSDKITHTVAEERWGRAKLPSNIQKALENPEGSVEDSDYLHVVEPNPDYIPSKGATNENRQKARRAKHFRFREFWIHKESMTLLETGFYRTFPYHVARSGVKLGPLPFGRSVAMDALTTLRELHRADQWCADASEMSLRPPALLPKGSIDPADWDDRSGARMVFNPIEGRGPEYLVATSNMEPMEMRILRKQRAVEDFFFVPMFQALDQISGSNPTATEVKEAARQGIQSIAPIIGSLEPDVYMSIVERILDLMDLHDLGTPKPDILQDKDIVISVTTQLDAELQTEDVRRTLVAMGQAFEIMKQFSENPEMNTLADRDRLIRNLLYVNNVDPEAVYDEQESKKKKEELQQAQKNQQMMQAAMEKVMPIDPLRAPESGSMADPAAGGLGAI